MQASNMAGKRQGRSNFESAFMAERGGSRLLEAGEYHSWVPLEIGALCLHHGCRTPIIATNPMWLFTRYGFFSTACAQAAAYTPDPTLISIRARRREHLE